MNVSLTDANVLKELCGEDRAVMQQLVSIFLRTFSDDLRSLHGAINAAEYVVAAAIAHKMAGSVQLVGAEATAKRLKSFSEYLYLPRVHLGASQWQMLQRELTSVLQEVSNYE